MIQQLGKILLPALEEHSEDACYEVLKYVVGLEVCWAVNSVLRILKVVAGEWEIENCRELAL